MLLRPVRELFAAALTDLNAGDFVTLQVHFSADEHPALLIMRALRAVRARRPALVLQAMTDGARRTQTQ
jgi:hypothetical protein